MNKRLIAILLVSISVCFSLDAKDRLRIAITGMPGSGKTSVWQRLRVPASPQSPGSPGLREAARSRIEELEREGQITSRYSVFKYFEEHSAEFQMDVTRQQLEAEREYNSKCLLPGEHYFDRGAYDAFAYLLVYNIDLSYDWIEEKIKEFNHQPYDVVFFFKPLAIYKQEGRSEGEDFAKKLHNELLQAYQKRGYYSIKSGKLLECSAESLQRYTNKMQIRPMITIPAFTITSAWKELAAQRESLTPAEYEQEAEAIREREINLRYHRVLDCIKKLRELRVIP